MVISAACKHTHASSTLSMLWTTLTALMGELASSSYHANGVFRKIQTLNQLEICIQVFVSQVHCKYTRVVVWH